MATFHLSTFQGSLEFLLQLIQRKEVDVTELSLSPIFDQFKDENSALEEGAEFIGSTSLLLFLKSKLLLPTLLQEIPLGEEEAYGALFAHLADYLKMREASRELELREEKTALLYDRGQVFLPAGPPPFPQVSLDELKTILEGVLKTKTAPAQKEIQAEMWQVADKIIEVRSLPIGSSFSLHELLMRGCCKEEVIATFLAVLELMKGGELRFASGMLTRTHD